MSDMKKPIQIDAPAPKAVKPYAFVPLGLYCNKELQQAKPGDVVTFCDGWRHEKRVLVRKCKVVVNSSAFTFLSKSIYGEHITAKELFGRWRAWAIVQGLSEDGFDTDNVLLIEVKEMEK